MSNANSKRSRKPLKRATKLKTSGSEDNKETVKERLDNDVCDSNGGRGSQPRPQRARKQKIFDGYVTPKGLDNCTLNSPDVSFKRKSQKALVTSTPVVKRSHRNNSSTNAGVLEESFDQSFLKPHISARQSSPTLTSFAGDTSHSPLVFADTDVVNGLLEDESLTSVITSGKSKNCSEVLTPPNKRRKITIERDVIDSKKFFRAKKGSLKGTDSTLNPIPGVEKTEMVSKLESSGSRKSARARKKINYLDLEDNEDVRTSEEETSLNNKRNNNLSRSAVKTNLQISQKGDTLENCLETENLSIKEKSKKNSDKNDSEVIDKPRRGRKRKRVQEAEEIKETDGIHIAESPSVALTRTARRKKNPSTVDHQDSNHAIQSDEKIETSAVKKRQGTTTLSKLKSTSSHDASDTNKVSTTKCTQVKNLQCGKCSTIFKSTALLKYHMMKAHSLVWSEGNPEGEDKPAVIIKLLGHVICQGCQKQFRFPQYYKQHLVWCGREHEMVSCEICTHQIKAQWYDKHLAVHKLKEKQTEMKKEREQQKTQEDAASDQEDNSRRSKRKAAKNAMKFISDIHKTKEAEDDLSGKSDKSYKSGDDSEDDDQDDIPDLSDEDHSDRHTKNGSLRVMDPSSFDGKWGSICLMAQEVKEEDRYKELHNFYTGMSLGGRLFPDLSPQVDNWVPLKDRDREKYLPHQKKSLSFTTGPLHKSSGINLTSLEWGQAQVIEGKSYSYCGGPIWSLEWCPIPQGAEQEQIIALSADIGPEKPPDTSATYSGSGVIQIFSTGSIKNDKESTAELSLQYCVAHDSGYVVSMSWCPHRCFDQEEVKNDCFKRLGLLAVACSDGSVLVYSLPQVQSLKKLMSQTQDSTVLSHDSTVPSHDSTVPSQDSTVPIFHPEPSLTLRPNLQASCGPCLCTTWQQGGEMRYIIAGYAQGCTLLWDLLSSTPLLRVHPSTLVPLQCFRYNTESILACAWNPRSPTIFATSSFDGSCCQWDTRTDSLPMAIFKHPHIFYIQHALSWAGPLINGFFACSEKFDYTENCPVTFYGLARGVLRNMASGILVQSHSACVWDVCFSPFYEVLASCDAIGKVKVMLPPMVALRTKAIKSHFAWHTSSCPSLALYQAKFIQGSASGQDPSVDATEHGGHTQNVSTHSTGSVSPGQGHELDISAETGSNTPANSSNNEELQLSTSTNIAKTKNLNKFEKTLIQAGNPKAKSAKKSGSSAKIPGHASNKSLQNSVDSFLYFESAAECKPSVKVSENTECEDYGGNNIQAVHRVRFNPNLACCLWLASGGEAGILQLHNLTSVVKPSRYKAHQFYEKHTKGKNS